MVQVPSKIDKPPYRVPSMKEIEAIPWNGYTVVSTFSGCGGSCLGYRMAGYKVLYANEFIPAAQETYKANHPDSWLDKRDIRHIQPQDIFKHTGLSEGMIDILDGSPPCASFSTAGKREAAWGKVKAYSDTKQRVDDLFFEYARLLKGLQPRIFVAENVSGLVKGTAKGYFLQILRELKSCGYTVEAKLLDAQWLGVPQMRQRLIFVGVRNDLVDFYHVKPTHPLPLPYNYTVREALPWIMQHGTHPAGTFTPAFVDSAQQPAAAVLTSVSSGSGLVIATQPVDIDAPLDGSQRLQVRAIRDERGAFGNGGDITDQPSPTILSGSVGTHWIEEQHMPVRVIHDTDGQQSKGDVTDLPAPTVVVRPCFYMEEQRIPVKAIHDTSGNRSMGDITDRPCPTRIVGHGSVDSYHYQIEEQVIEPESDISKYAIGREWDTLDQGEQSQKYFQLVKPSLNEPSPTIMQRGGDNTVASVTHPTEKRKFSIAELKRICAFPDDFILTGTYAQQWERLGRAVPPVMMSHVARTIQTEILDKMKRTQ